MPVARSRVKVAMPQRRGVYVPMKPMRRSGSKPRQRSRVVARGVSGMAQSFLVDSMVPPRGPRSPRWPIVQPPTPRRQLVDPFLRPSRSPCKECRVVVRLSGLGVGERPKPAMKGRDGAEVIGDEVDQLRRAERRGVFALPARVQT